MTHTPHPKTKTLRRQEAQKARVELAVYNRYVEDVPNVVQLRRLGRATAHIARCFRAEGVTVSSKTTLGELMRLMELGEINV